MKITKGKKIQRKGSKVVWHIDTTDEFASGYGWKGLKRVKEQPTEVRICCIPKNRTTEMFDWISVENLNKNWVEVK